MGEIDTTNKFLVGRSAKCLYIGNLARAGGPITLAESRNLAAWLGAMSDEPHEPFDAVLEAVRNT